MLAMEKPKRNSRMMKLHFYLNMKSYPIKKAIK